MLGEKGTRLDLLKLFIFGSTGVEDSPLVSLLIEALRVVDHHLSDFSILRVFGFGALEQRLEGKERGLDGEDRRPGSTKGIKTDGALVRYVSDL